MPYQFRVEDKAVSVEDVPLSVFAKIEADTGVSWSRLTVCPPAFAAAGEALAKACADLLSVELPTMTPRTITEVFELVDEETRPTEHQDGIPDPKAGGSEAGTT